MRPEAERNASTMHTAVCPSCRHEGTVNPNGEPCGEGCAGWQVDIRSNATRCPACGAVSVMVRKCPHCGNCDTFSQGLIASPGRGYCKRCGRESTIWDAPCTLVAARRRRGLFG